MKILHTSDWHIGSKLNGMSREAEQKAVIDEICKIADERDVDVAFVLGDIFNGKASSSYADKMIIDGLMKLSNHGNRVVVALLGNHDDPDRLSASKSFAEQQNIFFVTTPSYVPNGEIPQNHKINLVGYGRGYLKFQKGAETMVVNLMPCPSKWFRQENALPGETLKEKMKRIFASGTTEFSKETINVSIGHFFVPFEGAPANMSREVDYSVIPKAHYTALGHVHEGGIVDEKNNVIYSGSPMQVYFNEPAKKHVIVAELNNKGLLYKNYVRIKSMQTLAVVNAKNYDDLVLKLSSHDDSLVSVNLHEDSFTPSQIKKIRENYKNVVNINILTDTKKKIDVSSKTIEPVKVFSSFYKDIMGKEASENLKSTFIEAYEGGLNSEN